MIRPARPEDRDALLGFLARDRIGSVYLEALIREGALNRPGSPDQILVDDAGGPSAVFLTGPNIVISGDDPEALARIARFLCVTGLPPGTLIKSPRASVDGIWPRLSAEGIRAQWDRLEHRMELHPGEMRWSAATVPLRQADAADEPRLVASCAAMYEEDLGTDPRSADEAEFTRRVAGRIRQGRQFVWTADSGELRYQAYLSAITPACVQIQGVYVPPGQRGKGHGKSGMAALSSLLLERHPCVCLCVAESNRAAVCVYDQVGFRTTGCVRTILIGPAEAQARAALPPPWGSS